MRISHLTLSRTIGMLLLATLAGCGLPKAGPNKSQIFSGSVQRQGDAYIVEVNDRVTRATAVRRNYGFSRNFVSAKAVDADTIYPGDVLGLTVWENVDDGLLSGATSNVTMLEEMQVDGSGFIFVPYAGRIRAAGNTPEALRRLITARLDEQTPDPQVQVRRLAGDGSTVSLVGAIGAQGVYPIERPNRTLSTMLARAGGVSIEPEVTRVTVIRGDDRGMVWLEDLYEEPELDIALRGGDRILVEADTRTFTAMGATGGQATVKFEKKNLSAMEAMTQAGGLNTNAADPTGIFILRNEDPAILGNVLNRGDFRGAQRVIYVLDLTKPNGLFHARDFVIRDQDSIYVTEAPFTQWQKALSAFTGSLQGAQAVASTGSNF